MSSVDMFYDLNLGVDGVGDQTRREMVAMAMQLGYSGVAANHILSGVMADSDRCRLRPLELQTVLSAASGVAEAARFHRELLGVPHGLPFRQFSRITVVVETPAQANALNSGNPVLKTYDVVAVRPTNQKAFNQACSQLEVDLISLDVSQKLPFRLKMPVVKAAVERGIYFEISYGRTIFDPKARRELFANAQMLQAAARGRHIIVSSGARRAMELRGPNDAANMSTLFGLTLESAKAAVSRNCKEVLMHGVMRKATHRGAIHIGYTPVTQNGVNPENLFNVPMDWDPLSLGGGSADFIPVDNTADIVLKKDSPPHNTVVVTEESVKTTTWAGDIGDIAASSMLSSLNSRFKSFGDVNQSDWQNPQEEKVISGNSERDSTVSASHGHDRPAGSIGLKVYNSMTDSGGPSVNGKKENVQHFPLGVVGKQAVGDNKMKRDLGLGQAAPRKAKKRKRKR